MILIYLSSAWIIGIFLGSCFPLPSYITIIGVIPFVFIPFLPKHRTSLVIIGFCLFTLLIANQRFQLSKPTANELQLQFYNDKGVTQVEGLIITEPEVRDKTMLFQLSAQRINGKGYSRDISGKALVRTSRYNEYHYGDIDKINGNLETPQQINDFNNKDYLAHQDIYSLISGGERQAAVDDR